MLACPLGEKFEMSKIGDWIIEETQKLIDKNEFIEDNQIYNDDPTETHSETHWDLIVNLCDEICF